MKRIVLLAVFVCLLALSSSVLAKVEITGNVNVGEDLFVTFEFKGLDQWVYDQAQLQFNEAIIPEIIRGNFEKKNLTVGTRALPLEVNYTSRTIRSSFYLGGSAIVSFSVNQTTLRRVYEVKMDWRKFKVNLTNGFSVDFAQLAAKPVAEWQKPNATTFYLENRDTDSLDVLLYLVLPSSASSVQVEQDTVSYEVPPVLEDVLLGTPFVILIALAVALIIILLYRKAR